VSVILENQKAIAVTVPGWRETGKEAALAFQKEAVASHSRRRFYAASLGFWLGGIFLGTVGCLLGACMPYHHQVAASMSVIWWGIYLGCLGASFGVLLGRCACRVRQPGVRPGRPCLGEKLDKIAVTDAPCAPEQVCVQFPNYH
jgi:hypothetical protein